MGFEGRSHYSPKEEGKAPDIAELTNVSDVLKKRTEGLELRKAENDNESFLEEGEVGEPAADLKEIITRLQKEG